MREVPAMSECCVNKGKLQLQCKAGFQEPANCPWAANMLIHLTKSQWCVLYYHCLGYCKVWALALKQWGIEQARRKLEMRFSLELSLPADTYRAQYLYYRLPLQSWCSCSRYISLRWPIFLLQNYDSFKLSVCSTWRFLIHTPLCSPLEAVEMTSWL